MKLICILLLGLLSCPAVAKECDSIIHRFENTFFSPLNQASDTLKFVTLDGDEEFESSVKTLRETIDRNYLIYIAGLFKLQDGLNHAGIWEIGLNGKIYDIVRTRGLAIFEHGGPALMTWPTFDQALPAADGERRFRASETPVFTGLHFADRTLALTVLTKFLNELLNNDEKKKFGEESETRIGYMAWLNRFIDSLSPPHP